MAKQGRLLGIAGGLLLLGALAPGIALAADPVAKGDVVDPAPPIGPTVIAALANDDPGAATETRPLVITSVATPFNGTATTDGTSIVYDPTGCFTGINAFTYTITDGAKSVNGQVVVNVKPSDTAPVSDAPQVSIVNGSTMAKTSAPLRVSWCGIPTKGESLKTYKVYQSTDGGTTFGATPILASTATSISRTAGFTTSYAWRLTTTDTAATSDPATSVVTRVSRFEESSAAIAYSTGWKTASASKASGGKERYVTKSGATATLTVTGARQFAIVSSKGAGRGTFHVYVDGVRVTTTAISEKASSTSYRKILYVGTVPGDTSAQHTIRIRTSSKARINLDAILTLSAKPSGTIDATAPTTGVYRDAGADVSATSTSGLPVLLSVPSSSWATCSLTAGHVSYHGAGTCTLTATQVGDPSWNPRTRSIPITVAGAPLTITGITAEDRVYAPGGTAAALDVSAAAVDPADIKGSDSVDVDATGAVGTFATANAGTAVQVTVSGLSLTGPQAANYVIEPVTTSADIHKADQVITFDTTPGFRVKDGASYDVAASSTSGLGVVITVDASSSSVCTIAGLVVSFPGFGNCQLDANQPGDGNWNAAVQTPQSFSVASTGTDAQTISFTSLPDVTYGAAPVTLQATATSGLSVSFSSETASVCTASSTTLTYIASGTCTVTARQAGNPQYAPAPDQTQDITVARKNLTTSGVTASNKPYDGTTAATVNIGSASLVGVVGSDDVQLGAASAVGTFSSANVGNGRTVTITGLNLIGTKAGSYTLTQPSTTANITKATLTVTAQAKAITYGQAEPSYTFAYAGFASGESASVLDTAPNCDAATYNGNAGTWPITCSGGADGNYAFSYVGANLVVSQKPVTVTFTANSRAYDSTRTAAIAGCSIATIEVGDLATCSPAGASALFDTASVGTGKTVTGSSFSITGGDASNYTITAVNTTTANITRADPSCSITGYSVTYDGSPHTATGTCVGVIAEALAAPNLSATTHTNAGSYPTDAWTFTDVSGNYNNDSGTVADTISQASQTITFNALSAKTYGNAPFAVSATASSGLTVTFTSQTTSVCTVSTATVTLVQGGTCTIRASQAGTTNWAAAPDVDRSFTVNKATLTVTANAQTITYGAAAPAYTFAYGAFQGSDTSAVLDVPPTCSSAYAQGNNAGSYPITCSGGSDNQYAYAFTGATLTVNKANQTVAFDGSAPAGALVGDTPTQTATASSGLTAVITVDASSGSGVCSMVDADTVSLDAAGTCVLAANQAGSINYNAAAQVLRSFSVALQPQTITFGALADHIYGDSFTVSATATSGLAVTFSSQTTSVCTMSGTTVSVVLNGTCTIRASQGGNAQYAPATPVDETFTANPRPITVTAVTSSKVADGTTTSSGTPTVTAGSVLNGDQDHWSQTFDTAAAGTNKTLTPAGTITKGANNITSRYAITFQPVTTGTITAAAVATIALTASSPQVAGTPFGVTVTAHDTYGNVATGYTGTVHFTSNDGQAVLPSDYTFVGGDAGTHTFTNAVTLKTAGTRSLTVTDTGNGSRNDSASITVNAGAAIASITISPASASITAGGSQAYTATGVDAYGNSKGDVTSSVTFSIAPDGSCTGASCSADTAGAHTVTGTAVGGATDTASLTVNAGAAAALVVTSGASTATAGSPFSVTVTVKDGHDNTVTGFTGAIHFTSTDGQAVVPANYTYVGGDNGVHTFTNGVTLKTAGSRSVSANVVGSPSVNGSKGYTVDPGNAASLNVSVASPQTAGVPFSATVEAQDPYGNTATGYRGTVGFTTDLGPDPIGSDYTFTGGDAGIATVPGLVVNDAGSILVLVTDTVTGSITGSSNAVLFN